MGIKPGLLAIAGTALTVGLSGCGSTAQTVTSAPSPARSSPTMSSPEMSTSTGTAPSPSPAAAKPALITIKDFTFTVGGPVAAGSKVTVKNTDVEAHTVTSGPGAFDVTVSGGGGATTFKAPAKPGSYKFVCMLHGNMTGTLVVS
jgi:plastocyanin